MRGAMQVFIMLLLATVSDCAVITGDYPCYKPESQGFSRELSKSKSEERERINFHINLLQPFAWKACERDVQCGQGTCCAVSLWLRGLRLCTPLGLEGEECHPGSHKIPFTRKRQHHSCPCSPSLLCSRFLDGRYRCFRALKNVNF